LLSSSQQAVCGNEKAKTPERPTGFHNRDDHKGPAGPETRSMIQRFRSSAKCSLLSPSLFLGVALAVMIACTPGREQSPPRATDPSPLTESTSACKPTARITPTSGPVGTRVQIKRECFDPRMFPPRGGGGYDIFLIKDFRDPECELIAMGQQRIRVNASGRLTGYFAIPARGGCFQKDYDRAVTPGIYPVGAGCHPCQLRGVKFRVTKT
jgi:hypothetical protein